MNWEEFTNTDFYRESHPEEFEKPSREDKIAEEMRRYLGCLDAYNERIFALKEEQENDNDGDYDPCLDDGVLCEDKDTNERIVRYICTKLWNGRVRGILRVGTYKECLFARYNYNVACIDSEWDWAGIERIEAENEDELDDIIDGYREAEYEYDMYGDDDYDC